MEEDMALKEATLMAAKTLDGLDQSNRSRGSTPDVYKQGSWFGTIARSLAFEQATFFLIATNAVWIGIEVSNNDADSLADADWGFQVVEHLFCFCFSLEWFVRLMAYRRKQDILKDLWFLFDTLLVAFMVIETWVIYFIVMAIQSDQSNQFSSLTMLRLLRLLRVTRITRLMRAMPEMMVMIRGMASATRSVLITLFLLFIMVYVFAVLLVQLTRDSGTYLGREHFDGVLPAMYTLMKDGILPDQGELLEELGRERWYVGVIFFIFVVIATLTIINMLIGILCEVIVRISASEKEKMDIEIVTAKLQSIVAKTLDRNGDNKISRDEFLDISKHPDVCRALKQVGVDARDLVSHTNLIFDAWSDEGEWQERRLDFDGFMQEVLKHRGTNAATIKDITSLRKFVQESVSGLERSAAFGGGGYSQSQLRLSRSNGGESSTANLGEDAERSRPADVHNERAAACVPDAIEELPARMERLENLMEQVLQGQIQIQSIMRERLQPPREQQKQRAPSAGAAARRPHGPGEASTRSRSYESPDPGAEGPKLSRRSDPSLPFCG
eukprot:CAMPEP_0168465270 /NCGR_PEP_ID=MMETSP0228-20121227/56022_1 /TAXON_ID=133427 /ORGANISM="Protoceratium reticulatum, Strain CCCM 535 (=CCMP 1889)" /LENGTH=554 /DNA_ID=CAMNT_0008480827 /DNA_START=90 /DNA_END=1751 /DNA_ORIENTATION=+